MDQRIDLGGARQRNFWEAIIAMLRDDGAGPAIPRRVFASKL